MNNFLKNLLTDIKVELAQEFDRNFERKGFFDQKWPQTKLRNHRGSLMMRSGKLRRSISAKVGGNAITFSSNMPYAAIHNEGGEITVTAKMKRYFWAMHYKAGGAISPSSGGRGARNQRLSGEAAQWKALALMKVGTKMKIQQRQFIGHHPRVDQVIKQTADHNFKELQQYITNHLKQK